ncbi:uncharacterized protein LOC141593152 [Silene latifolia]|uniref:uncharacterized protein LOC141593152 n=1 Tax=Silene latifolia TaxID=37657 RepID=UPI003D7708E5
MARKENVEAMDTLLRDLCHPDVIFGGKLIVFGDDFRQILPVVPQKSNREVVAYSLVSSKLWPQRTKFRLTENIRDGQDPAFSAFLLALGNGELETGENVYVELPPGIVRYPEDESNDPINQKTELAFPKNDLESYKPEIITTRAILTQ